jgi:predicted HTH domain antitoxin
MKQLTINIPENTNLDKKETKRFLAAKMYEAGKLTLKQAAEIAGMSVIAFSEILADYNVSFINHEPNEIIRDAGKF